MDKSTFIRRYPGLSPLEVSRLAAKRGMFIDPGYVSKIRQRDHQRTDTALAALKPQPEPPLKVAADQHPSGISDGELLQVQELFCRQRLSRLGDTEIIRDAKRFHLSLPIEKVAQIRQHWTNRSLSNRHLAQDPVAAEKIMLQAMILRYGVGTVQQQLTDFEKRYGL